jgi:imidazole glycerol-phosphate synthase subunit HisF
MLKNRVLSSIIFNGKTIVRGKDFINNRPVGSLIQQVKIYNLREIDELIIYSINNNILSLKNLENISKSCFMPLSIGGGIKNILDIEFLLTNGADKVILNSSCAEDTSFLEEAIRCFGSQAITVGVDFRKIDNELKHFIKNGTKETGKDLVIWCKHVENIGAGEIIITCIDNDGRQIGYNIEDTLRLTQEINIPVVISGGAGTFDDFYEALVSDKIDAVCASSFYLFNKYTPLDVKKFLRRKNMPVRYSNI